MWNKGEPAQVGHSVGLAPRRERPTQSTIRGNEYSRFNCITYTTQTYTMYYFKITLLKLFLGNLRIYLAERI